MIECRIKVKHHNGEVDFFDDEFESTTQAHIAFAEKFPSATVTVWAMCQNCNLH